jgi:NADPH-dependent ferric siderophore reductase
LADASLWTLEVRKVTDLTRSMRRITVWNEGLGAMPYRGGQDLMIGVPTENGGTFRRRYTIRRRDVTRSTMDIDFVRHGDGPGARWAETVRPGDRVDAIGPRGKIWLADEAEWHLFLGDETALPGFLAMLAELPASERAIAVGEVGDTEDELTTDTDERISFRWLHRGEAEPGTTTHLADAARDIALPTGSGHAYLAGELRVVAAVRKVLESRGLSPTQISAKPYWRRGVANAAHGEPERD